MRLAAGIVLVLAGSPLACSRIARDFSAAPVQVAGAGADGVDGGAEGGQADTGGAPEGGAAAVGGDVSIGALAGDGGSLNRACGDGHLDQKGACDDGNDEPADGCDGGCKVESGWTCAGEHSTCGDVDESALATSASRRH